MNPILQVKLKFAKERNNQTFGPKNLRKGAEVTTEHVDSLCEDIQTVLRYYRNNPRIIDKILIDVNYTDIIAKSRRIQELLKPKGKDINEFIVGARFSNAPYGEENHIITYYVDEEALEATLKKLREIKRFLLDQFEGKACVKNFNEPENLLEYRGYELKKNKIRNLIVDCSVVDSLSIPHISEVPTKDTFLVTFYKTELNVASILEKLNIDEIKYKYSFYGDDTIAMTKELYNTIEPKVPYLISMVSHDFSKITLEEIGVVKEKEIIEIPEPGNEPIIGVIDNLFDENVYFSDWVDNNDFLDEYQKILDREKSRDHGTEVTSIIVDGPTLNPWLDDGCGRFRVRHFGVSADKISTARLVRKIEEIVTKNSDIHVWNLSLGIEDEISRNFISYDGAFLDKLQAEKNIIFVISGTNDNRREKEGVLRVGPPADSLNSLVVNSVKRNGSPAEYSRKGNVLSFFNKPDVSYYGGDYDEPIIAYSSNGKTEVYGTSFAAPWISRKLSYLIDIIGLPREVAKAVIIDSAAGWDYKQGGYKLKDRIGYGIVPIDINKILESDNDEIKFVIYGTSEAYKTVNYAIPVPRDEDDKYPYIARATMCYFPECTRSQGVDYTNRELSLKFGRINFKGNIIDINENTQDESGVYNDERQSRREFRKWENTKFISRVLKNNKALKAYGERLWGISVTSKDRLTTRINKGLNFGAIITLKEVNGINRIQDFIRACTLRGWIVNELDINNQVELYNSNQEEIIFD